MNIYIIMTFIDVSQTDTSVLLKEKNHSLPRACNEATFLDFQNQTLPFCLYAYTYIEMYVHIWVMWSLWYAPGSDTSLN